MAHMKLIFLGAVFEDGRSELISGVIDGLNKGEQAEIQTIQDKILLEIGCQ